MKKKLIMALLSIVLAANFSLTYATETTTDDTTAVTITADTTATDAITTDTTDDEEEAADDQEKQIRNNFNERKEIKKQTNEMMKLMRKSGADKNAVKEVQNTIKELDKEAKNLRKILRERVLATYTEEELAQIQEMKGELEQKYQDLTVIDVDSIICSHSMFKFDMPPVIKEGRTLVPVRAISEGFKADVKWDSVLKKVTITKGDTVIELIVDQRIAYVNGEEVQMDTQANIMNSRTIVPLRFIAEALNLTVEWDEEDGTIEIDEETTDEVITTTGSAITTQN